MPESSIHSIIPDPEQLLALEPEELAAVVLEVLNSLPEDSGQHNRRNFTGGGQPTPYPQPYQDRISRALTEAWVWLEREGLIAPRPGEQSDWVFVTRRGKQLRNREDFISYRSGDVLPRKQLHPVIATKVWSAFIRGDYDTAVFQVFKQVEVEVRKAGRYPDTLLGVDLMRRAFHPDTGPLTNNSLPPGERQALSDLFAGAIGSYKNPSSHRQVVIDPTEAVEMIMLASHLLKIVDSRAPTRQSEQP
jgi:uncharacterized protein (TIGR02391 family)